MWTLILAAFGVLLLAAFAVGRAVVALWNSRIFWLFAVLLTVAALPLTAGMSPLALVALVALRLVLVGKMIDTSPRRY